MREPNPSANARNGDGSLKAFFIGWFAMSEDKKLSQQRLQELLHYDGSTGIFIWRVTNNNRIRVGAAAGTPDKGGYIRIRVEGRRYSAHRLAWFYVHGHFPPADIDHIDRQRANNSINNLRLASRTENNVNSKIYCTNTSGFKGVSWDRYAGKWRASAGMNLKHRHLGYFTTAEAASVAYEAFARQHHGEFYLANGAI